MGLSSVRLRFSEDRSLSFHSSEDILDGRCFKVGDVIMINRHQITFCREGDPHGAWLIERVPDENGTIRLLLFTWNKRRSCFSLRSSVSVDSPADIQLGPRTKKIDFDDPPKVRRAAPGRAKRKAQHQKYKRSERRKTRRELHFLCG